MCSQSGEGETLLSNFACHLSPNHFKDEAFAKDFLPFSPCLFPFLSSLSFPPFLVPRVAVVTIAQRQEIAGI